MEADEGREVMGQGLVGSSEGFGFCSEEGGSHGGFCAEVGHDLTRVLQRPLPALEDEGGRPGQG